MNTLAELLALCRDIAAGNVGVGELPGVLRAFADALAGETEPQGYHVTERGIAALGTERPTARRLSRPERVALALAMLGAHRRITSGELAQRAACDAETARLDLARLAREGRVESLGTNKGRVYLAKK